jgi:hypothetical protein
MTNNLNLNAKNNNNKGLFRSFSGNDNNIDYYIINVNSLNSRKNNKYSVNNYRKNEKEKDTEKNSVFAVNKTRNNSNKNSLDIGKYTPVRGIKNFSSKTTKKISHNPKIYNNDDINNILFMNDNINNNKNYNIFDNDSIYNSYILMKNKNKKDMNINLKENVIYHKKKLNTPNHLSGTFFLENNYFSNTTYCDNLDNNKSMYSTNINNSDNNQFEKTKITFINSNININNNNNTELNNTSKSFYNSKTFFNINQINSNSFIQQNIVEENKTDNQIINRIEEKEINFALYKRNNSYDKSTKDSNNNTYKKDEIINIIYKKGNLINHNYNNNMKNNNNIIFNLKDRYKEKEKIYEHFHHKSAFFRNIYVVDDVFEYFNEGKNMLNNSISFFGNKKRIIYL